MRNQWLIDLTLDSGKLLEPPCWTRKLSLGQPMRTYAVVWIDQGSKSITDTLSGSSPKWNYKLTHVVTGSDGDTVSSIKEKIVINIEIYSVAVGLMMKDRVIGKTRLEVKDLINPKCSSRFSFRKIYRKNKSGSFAGVGWIIARVKLINFVSIDEIEQVQVRITEDELWKRIWKAEVPEKVKNVVWMAATGGLPTMEVLARRGVKVDPVCSRCGEEYETTTHMALFCKESQLMWRISPLRLRLEVNKETRDSSFVEWCGRLANKYNTEHSWEIILMFIWQIWNMRNSWVLHNKKIDPSLASARAMSLLGEFEDSGECTGSSVANGVIISAGSTNLGMRVPN